MSSRGLGAAEGEAERSRAEGARLATDLQRLHQQLDSLHTALRFFLPSSFLSLARLVIPTDLRPYLLSSSLLSLLLLLYL